MKWPLEFSMTTPNAEFMFALHNFNPWHMKHETSFNPLHYADNKNKYEQKFHPHPFEIELKEDTFCQADASMLFFTPFHVHFPFAVFLFCLPRSYTIELYFYIFCCSFQGHHRFEMTRRTE